MTPTERERIDAAAREWAEKAVAEHGPIPDHILRDLARDLRAAHARARTELLKPIEAAAELRLTKSSIYRLIAEGELPTVHVGPQKATRIRRSDLLAYIERHTRTRGTD